MKMSIKEKWSKRELEKQIDFSAFENWLLQQNNFVDTLPDLHNNADISLLIKDRYDFSFLDLEEDFLEKTLEDLLVSSIEKTLKNFGTYFSFV
jgi:predicted nuclease of restriction endonuclease-like (RecB) superfamily